MSTKKRKRKPARAARKSTKVRSQPSQQKRQILDENKGADTEVVAETTGPTSQVAYSTASSETTELSGDGNKPVQDETNVLAYQKSSHPVPRMNHNQQVDEKEEENLPPELKELAFYVARNVQRDEQNRLRIVYASLKKGIISSGSAALQQLWAREYKKNYLDLVPKSKLNAFREHRTLLLRQDDEGKPPPRHNLMVPTMSPLTDVAKRPRDSSYNLSKTSLELAEIYADHIKHSSSQLANWERIKETIFEKGSTELKNTWIDAEKRKPTFANDKTLAIVPSSEIKAFREYRDLLVTGSLTSENKRKKKKTNPVTPEAGASRFRHLSPKTRELAEFTAKSCVQQKGGKNRANWQVVDAMINESGSEEMKSLWNASKSAPKKRALAIIPGKERADYRAYRDFLVNVAIRRSDSTKGPISVPQAPVGTCPSTVTSIVLTARTMSNLSTATKELAAVCGRCCQNSNMRTQWDKVEEEITTNGSEELKNVWLKSNPNGRGKAKKYRLLVPSSEIDAFHALRKEFAQKYHPELFGQDEKEKRVNQLREERRLATVAANEIHFRTQAHHQGVVGPLSSVDSVFQSLGRTRFRLILQDYKQDITRFFKWRFKRLQTISDETIEDWKECVGRQQGSGIGDARKRLEDHFGAELGKLTSLREVYRTKFAGDEAELVDAFFSRLVASWEYLKSDIVGLWDSFKHTSDIRSVELKQRVCWQYFEAADKAWVSLHLKSLE